MAKQRILVVGLGNPGKEYAKNRHNAGFMLLDRIAVTEGVKFDEDKYMLSWLSATPAYLLAKALTYVNNTGEAVSRIVEKDDISRENIWVIQDDTEFPLGEVRIKFGGDSGGHNGIKSIDQKLGTNGYWRIRIGIGRPENTNYDLADYVLADFPASEIATLSSVIDQTVAHLLKCLTEGKIEALSFTIKNGKETTNNSN
jgi:PTH1 family peptidyl-tRNA hydrolase